MTGAFFLTIKRYAEFRHIEDFKLICQYRKSFNYYDEEKLLFMAILFAFASLFTLAIFFFQLNPVLIAFLPCYILVFIWYVKIGMSHHSPAQHPELLYNTEPYFSCYTICVGLLTLVSFPLLICC